jgi:WD40 repeat protein
MCLPIHSDLITDIQFSADGRRVLVALADQSAVIWNIDPGPPSSIRFRHREGIGLSEAYQHWQFRGDPSVMFAARFSPDSKSVVTASCDGTIRLWDAQTGSSQGMIMQHEDAITSLVFSPEGKRLLSASRDGTARLWDAETGMPVAEPMQHKGRVFTARFDSDGNQVVTASEDGNVQIWDGSTAKALEVEPLQHAAGVNSAEFSPDGRWVVTVCEDGAARVWDVRLRTCIAEPLKCSDKVTSATFSPDGRYVITTSSNEAQVWFLPDCSLRPPIWLAGLCESIAGRRFNRAGFLEEVPPDELDNIKKQIVESSDPDMWTLWAKWVLTDRCALPASLMSVPASGE